LARKDQPPCFRERGQRLAIIRVVRPAGIQRIFVYLKPLARRPAKDHRPQTPVTDWQRLNPLAGRLFVPKLERWSAGVSGDGIRAQGAQRGRQRRAGNRTLLEKAST